MAWSKWSAYGDAYPSVGFGSPDSLEPVADAVAKPAASTSGAAAGAAAGAAGGPLGIALGAGIGGLISLIGGLFGAGSKKEQQIREAKTSAAQTEGQNKINAVERGTQNSQNAFNNLIGVYRQAML